MKLPEDFVKHAACLIDATHYKRSSDVWNTCGFASKSAAAPASVLRSGEPC